MKNILLNNWNFMRGLRLVLGLAIFIQGLIAHENASAFLGLAFAGLALANIGGCGASGCAINNRGINSKKINSR